MNEEIDLHQLLRAKVERTAGFTPKSPKDFTRLEREIFAATRELISTSTLKRFWGRSNSMQSRTCCTSLQIIWEDKPKTKAHYTSLWVLSCRCWWVAYAPRCADWHEHGRPLLRGAASRNE